MESPSESDPQVDNIIVEKYEDCESEEIASELTEDEQSGDQILGYLEVQGHNGSQDATIYLDSQGLNLNGKRLILTQNDEGIIVVVSNDSNGQPLEDSVIHSDSETLVVAETSQSLEFINSDQPREVYIENENNGEMQMDEESSHWCEEQTSKSTEMLFIPNPTVMLAPEETKHPKLMQLACIAHQLQSADTQKETPPQQEVNEEPVIDNTVSVIQSTSSNEHCNVAEKETVDINCAPTVVALDGVLQIDEQVVDKVLCNNLETECSDKQTNGVVNVETIDALEDKTSKKSAFKKDNVVSEKNRVIEEKKSEKITNSNLTTVNQRTVPVIVEKDSEYTFSESDDLEMILPPKKSYSSPKKYSIFSSKSKVKTLFSTGTPPKVPLSKLEHKIQEPGLNKDKVENTVVSPQTNLSEYDNPLDNEDNLISDKKEIKKFYSLKARNLSKAINAESREQVIQNKDSSVKKDSVLELNNENLSKHSKGVIEDVPEETTHVKPPKKTYIRKRASENISTDISHDKIELFSVDGFSNCDRDIEQAELTLRGEEEPVTIAKETSSFEESSQVPNSVGIKVSATYNRKKKEIIKKQDRPLRRRLKKDTEKSPEVSNNDSSSENIAWADVLLRTSFDNPSVPSPPHSQPSPKKQRKQSPKKSKPDSAFDSLLLTPKKRKIANNKKFISNIVKKAKSRLENRKSAWKDNSGPKVFQQGCKRARMRFTVRPKVQEQVHEKMDETDFSCSSCDFVSTLVNNLIEHLKYCEKRQPPLDYPVDDMEKRQRIRGENTDNRSDSILEFLSSGSFDAAAAAIRGECSGTPQNTYDSDDELYYVKNKFGYGEDDIVWAKVEDRFWPALVCKITEGTAFVMLVNYPTERKGLKKHADRLHTFHDAKWNKMLLMEAASLPHNEIFVKAVQTSETYVRKKWLGFSVRGKDFFSIPDEVVYTTDEESCDESNINEDSDFDLVELDAAIKPSRLARYQKLDVEKIKDYILKGNLDTYVLDIFHRRQSSRKHMKYFSEGRSETSLTQRTWFGPCEKMFEQGILLDYFHSLFLNQIGERNYYLSYILQVWIPEVIVKAISETHRIPMKEAETLFESDDSNQAEGKEDPSMEAIEKLYS